jgi:galactose-1-phosphate uridylyltransferase
MLPELVPETNYLFRMADGTIKQVNPFTGTEVWTVPGRGNRPIAFAKNRQAAVGAATADSHCAFCAKRYLETPPEKSRLVFDNNTFVTLRNISAEDLERTRAEFRRIPNLFEIVSFEYWTRNYGYEVPAAIESRKLAYLSSERGREHVFTTLENRLRASGMEKARIAAIPRNEKAQMINAFFAGGHELIVARRHFVDGARFDDELASSGTLTPEEHFQYIRFTVESIREIYLSNQNVRYVSVFQNWLRPAGASFDHLHKQMVAIDDYGSRNETEMLLAKANPNIYNEAAVNFASYRNLVFAENSYAIAFAGFGHRFPTLEIFSKSARCEPWNHGAEEIRGMSDLIHACHAAMGVDIPCNEEWHYKPPGADVAMPWRVLIKWRVSNPAGFEGGTRIYVNTISPHSLRDLVVPRLFQLKNENKIAMMKIAFECDCVPNCLEYNSALRRYEGGGIPHSQHAAAQ